MFKRFFIIGLNLIMIACGAICWSEIAPLKVGMVSEGSIDDKSFNQGTWEGIQRAAEKYNLEIKYLKANGNTEADYLKEVSNLHDAGFNMIFCPGFKMQTAVFQAQQKYPDTKFVQIDGKPHAGDFKPVIKKNTIAVIFAEHEAGFLAGLAAALQLKEGEAGFIGGMAVPEVQKFNWGFQQGIVYANKNLRTKIIIKPENIIYIGTYTDVAAGQLLAGQMFEKGVKVIFCAAGVVGMGAINEAKTRVKNGDKVWIIGVDRDQYDDGVYNNTQSVILTSAVKRLDQASFAIIKAEKEGKFLGGEALTFDVKTNGVGLPVNNPSLSKEVQNQVAKVLEKLKSGEIVVSNQQGDLIK
jgi:basic membrane protein A and related proteins